jgi:hypothetical protein
VCGTDIVDIPLLHERMPIGSTSKAAHATTKIDQKGLFYTHALFRVLSAGRGSQPLQPI